MECAVTGGFWLDGKSLNPHLKTHDAEARFAMAPPD
jgi:hypothetical protein